MGPEARFTFTVWGAVNQPTTCTQLLATIPYLALLQLDLIQLWIKSDVRGWAAGITDRAGAGDRLYSELHDELYQFAFASRRWFPLALRAPRPATLQARVRGGAAAWRWGLCALPHYAIRALIYGTRLGVHAYSVCVHFGGTISCSCCA